MLCLGVRFCREEGWVGRRYRRGRVLGRESRGASTCSTKRLWRRPFGSEGKKGCGREESPVGC